MTAFAVRGQIPSIVRNDGNLYEGSLVWYFQKLWHLAQNLRNPYHNFRHPLHVLWLCHDACLFYGDKLTPRQMRNLLIAALLHDVDHSGKRGDDDLNIERAIRWFVRHMAGEDIEHQEDIALLMRATEFAHKEMPEIGLSGGILRDADSAQSLEPAWIQQVIFGLAAEWNMTPTGVLQEQPLFLGDIKWNTTWAQERFPQSAIDEKVHEAKEFLALLGEVPITRL